MGRKPGKASHPNLAFEIGTIRKSWRGKVRIALVYPNRYHVGMSNLGFQTLYHLMNSYEHVVCERVFLPEEDLAEPVRLTTIESGRSVASVDIIAFSLAFENDYPNVLAILAHAGIPLRSSERNDHWPLVVAGGVVCFLNPEPIAAFIDCFFIGEAEGILPRFFHVFDPAAEKNAALKRIAREVPGAYVPSFYRIHYGHDGILTSFDPVEDVPATIRKVYVKDIDGISTCSAIVTANAAFDRSFLIEVARGCPHGCRFCCAGYIYRPPRFRSPALLAQNMLRGAELTDNIGLVGAAVSDLPGIEALCIPAMRKDLRLSFSSLRADRLTPGLIAALQHSDLKTATIAPEVGSDRLRNVINKGISDEDILNAASLLVENGIPNIKLYFMIGLPTETEADVNDIIQLCKRIKHRFLASSRTRQHIGLITVSLNSFVPKPFTPFQWAAMDEVNELRKKIKKIKNELKKVANLRINADIPRWAYIQALFSRGDRKVADILSLAHANRGNWAQTLKGVPLNADFYVLRERDINERLPWDFIDHGINKSFLQNEYKRAKQGLTTPACRVESCTTCGVCQPKAAKP